MLQDQPQDMLQDQLQDQPQDMLQDCLRLVLRSTSRIFNLRYTGLEARLVASIILSLRRPEIG